MLFDYSKTFDRLQHRLLPAIIYYIGFSNDTIGFFRNYLVNRFQRVKLNCVTSDLLPVNFGGPQGSILGPLLFTKYTSDFINTDKDCRIHFYAGDTQRYYSLKL